MMYIIIRACSYDAYHHRKGERDHVELTWNVTFFSPFLKYKYVDIVHKYGNKAGFNQYGTRLVGLQ